MSTSPPYQKIVEGLPNGIVLLDAGGLITYMNPAAERLTGAVLSEARGIHWKDVFTIKVEDPAGGQTGSLMEILLERPLLITKTGATIPIELEIAPVSDEQDRPIGSMLILHDVTDLEAEKEGLKESRSKYKRLVNSIEGIVWEASVESGEVQIHFVSDYAEKMLGYSPKSWTKQPDFWKTILHPEDRKSVLEVVSQSVLQKESYQMEYRVVSAKGNTVLVRDSVTLAASDDHVLRLTGVMTDVTASKQARDRLVRSEELFSAAFYSNPAALLLISEDGEILDANDSFEKASGLFREHLLGKNVVHAGLCTTEEFSNRTQDANWGFGLIATIQPITAGNENCLVVMLQKPGI